MPRDAAPPSVARARRGHFRALALAARLQLASARGDDAESVARVERMSSDSQCQTTREVLLAQGFALSARRCFWRTAPWKKSKGARDIRDPSGSTDPSPLAERRQMVVKPQVSLDRDIPRAMGYSLLRGPPEA